MPLSETSSSQTTPGVDLLAITDDLLAASAFPNAQAVEPATRVIWRHGAAMAQEIRRLRDENERLRAELASRSCRRVGVTDGDPLLEGIAVEVNY